MGMCKNCTSFIHNTSPMYCTYCYNDVLDKLKILENRNFVLNLQIKEMEEKNIRLENKLKELLVEV